jgi:hypothetical protein
VGDNIESNSLRKGAALTDGDNITILNGECRRAVGCDVLMPLLVSAVLDDVVKVIPSDNDSVLHLGGDHHTIQNSSTDGNIAGEGALLVDKVGLDGTVGSLDSETDVLDETHGTGLRRLDSTLAGDKDGILLLVCLLGLVALGILLRNSRHLYSTWLSEIRRGKRKKLAKDVRFYRDEVVISSRRLSNHF